MKRISNEWNTVIILLVFNKGDPKNCANYQGISRLCAAFKVYKSIIEKKLRTSVEPM